MAEYKVVLQCILERNKRSEQGTNGAKMLELHFYIL